MIKDIPKSGRRITITSLSKTCQRINLENRGLTRGRDFTPPVSNPLKTPMNLKDEPDTQNRACAYRRSKFKILEKCDQ
jgi:hypothetical protein